MTHQETILEAEGKARIISGPGSPQAHLPVFAVLLHAESWSCSINLDKNDSIPLSPPTTSREGQILIHTGMGLPWADKGTLIPGRVKLSGKWFAVGVVTAPRYLDRGSGSHRAIEVSLPMADSKDRSIQQNPEKPKNGSL